MSQAHMMVAVFVRDEDRANVPRSKTCAAVELGGQAEEILTSVSEEHLVGSDHVLAVAQGLGDDAPGRFDAADEFNDDVQSRVVHGVLPVG